MSRWTRLPRHAARILVIAAMTALSAACASVDAPGPASVERGSSQQGWLSGLPQVLDPAPIVSGTMRRYQIRGRWYQPEDVPDYDAVGLASWYGDAFHGRPTATGERFDMNALTAAHKTLPLPGLVEVTNLSNGRRVILRVNDRGPFVDDRIIDLSRAAADALDLRTRGVGEVRVRYVGRAPRVGGGAVLQTAQAPVPSAPVAGPVPPSEASAYWVQAVEYPAEAAAWAAAQGLGGAARVQAASDRSRFRVLLGPWPDANAAEQARQAAVARGYGQALLISSHSSGAALGPDRSERH